MKHAQSMGYPGSMTRKKPRVSPGLFLGLCLILAFVFAAAAVRGGIFRDVDREAQNQPIPDAPSAPAETVKTDQTDDLLILVNADHPLPEGYAPRDLVLLNELESSLFTVKEPNTYLCRSALTALNAMLSDAHQQGLTQWQISEGYRSRAAQQAIWDQKYVKYRTVNGLSESKALQAVSRRVAKPGCSEHETGLALDLTVPGAAFRSTPQCLWIQQHCAEYGFILRYTEDKEKITGITAEPWHIRFVGVEAAQEMREKNLCLEEYAADQEK